MMLASISEDLAKVNKIDINKYNFIYLLAIAIIVALGVKVVGSLLIGALVIIPAAASRIFSANMKQYVFWSALFGVLSSVFGILLAKAIQFPVGPLIILVCIVFFVVSLVFKKK